MELIRAINLSIEQKLMDNSGNDDNSKNGLFLKFISKLLIPSMKSQI